MNQYLITNRNVVLRKILATNENVEILKDMIESILKIEIQKIQLNEYIKEKENYLPKEENFGVADVRITTNNNKQFNIGMTFLDGKHIQTKIAMYYLYIHTNQIYYDDKRIIAKTITINFLDFPYYNSKEYHTKAILNKFKTIDFSEQEAETHIIELPKLKITDQNKITKQEQWISYLKGEDTSIIEKVKQKNKYIQKLDEQVQKYWEEEKI